MNTTARILIVGDIESVERKPAVNGSALTEFRIKDFALRCAAWRDLAAAVPDAGPVVVEGRAKTRHYTTKNGEDRSTTEVTVSSIESLAAGTAPDDDMPF